MAHKEHNTRRGELCRPWIQYRDSSAPVRIFFMTKQKFKFYADLRDKYIRLLRTLSVLDTDGGPNCIRKNATLTGDLNSISYGRLPDIADANSNPIHVEGIELLLVRLKTRAYLVESIVCDSLAGPVILGCDFCDKHVESILPRQRLVELEDGTTIPIVRKLLGWVTESRLQPLATKWKNGVT